MNNTSESRVYDFIVCGSGSSGSVVARRLAENPDVSVLLLEAGGDDEAPSIMEADRWIQNLGTERDWQFQAAPNPSLNGRAIPLSMGKVLGGGSSINAMVWSRGHQRDWDFFASESGDRAWGYESVLDLYRRIEDWHGAPDPAYRGTGGPMFVQPKPDPQPIGAALLEGIGSAGIPLFENPNGRMMEAEGGGSRTDMRIRDGRRQSVFRSYAFPYMDRPNLTVLSRALVTRLTFSGRRATGLELTHEGKRHYIVAGREVILSLGAMHTPKVLMQSGVGDENELRRFGIPVVQHLPGVGRGLQDHPLCASVWEHRDPLPPTFIPEVTVFSKSPSGISGPDMHILHGVPFASPENVARFGMPASGWALFGVVIQPKSRGRLRLTGPDPSAPLQIEANHLSDPEDLAVATACVELSREIGNSVALRPFVKREVMPGNLDKTSLERFVRDGVSTYWHVTSTAKMGRDAMSVVGGDLKVYGLDNLRIADASIMPRVTTGSTMAPCVIIGERAAALIRDEHQIALSGLAVTSESRRMRGDHRQRSGARSVGLRISHSASAEAAQDAKMTEAERAELVELLLRSEREFMRELEGVNERQWSFKLGPDRWSVGEVVEHIVLADGLLFDTATKSLTGQPDAQWDETLSKTETLRRALPDRSCRVDAPGVMQPRRAMPREKLLSRFIDQRARVLKYARETDAPLKAHTAANPFFGRLNAHQWLLYIPLHHLRHNQQIAEVKTSADYPRY